ncbi:ABC transporter permease [Streptomyces sp. NPDC000658]|uniref:ABC transporter permease n=1 Tax=Streptomyces sp. NPDC000658 TaxID=3154266 RepID=UPI00331A2582
MLESVAAAISVIVFVLTLLWRDWIERLFGVDPDQGSGALEWIIVALAFCSAIIFGLLARSEWHRARVPVHD